MRLVLLAIGLAALLPVQAYGAGNVETGRLIAETWCKPCHAIGSPRGTDVAQPFADIAAKRTAQSIGAFLADPHGAMPNIQLSRQQIDDVIAYMESLKGR